MAARESNPDNMLDLVQSREFPEFPLGSDVSSGAEGELLFASDSVHSVKGGSMAGATVDWRRSDC